MVVGEYRMRAIEEDDLELIWKWRNSERIHSMMLTPHKISWEEHKNWFENIVSNQEIPLHFVFEYQNKSLGYIGYTQVDFINKRCSPGAYIGNALDAPIDAGVALMYMSMAYPLDHLGFNKLSTIVFKNNKKAYKMDKIFGYEEEGFLREHFLVNDLFLDAYMLGILKTQWELKKAEFIELIGYAATKQELMDKSKRGGVVWIKFTCPLKRCRVV